jgi:NAD(P)H-hydrate epimerase
MRLPSLTREAAREIDRRAIEEFGVSSLVLMENAGRGAADVLTSLGATGRVLVVCGKGNNGGDGLVLARHLAVRGIPFDVLLTSPPEHLSPDARANHDILHALGVPMPVAGESFARRHLDDCEWAVDALLGTGLKGPVFPPYDGIINAINESHAKVLAIDIPSGLDANTGEPLGVAVRACHTVTFVAPKRGFDNPDAAYWTGRIHVADIGIPPRIIVSSPK